MTGDPKPKLRPQPPVVTREHPTKTEVPVAGSDESRIQDLQRALEWALHFVRLPSGVDAEAWAKEYSRAVELAKK